MNIHPISIPGTMEVEEEEEEVLTPMGQVFTQRKTDQVMNCVMGLKNPINLEAIKAELKNSILLQHPRFCSLLVRDKLGRKHWRKTHVDLEKHILIREIDNGDTENEEIVNGYLADLAISSPLNRDRPLWEFHVLLSQKCCIFRVHHSLGDGMSLMSLLVSWLKKVDRSPSSSSSSSSFSSTEKKKQKNGDEIASNVCKKVWNLLVVMWFSLIFIVKFIFRSFWVKDENTIISTGAGVELWPRMLVTAKFKIEDMKAIKASIPNATVNDVLSGVISCGLSRYLNLSSPNKIREGLQITGLAVVNLRPQSGLQNLSFLMKNKKGSRWGNQFGFVLFPVKYHKDVENPLQHVKRAKALMDRKKKSFEAHFCYMMEYIISFLLGNKVAAWFGYRLLCNTSFLISNIAGPQEEIMIGGNPITYLRLTISSLPNAITMHMVSYAGKAEMQILVAKNIIPDPQILAKCFEDVLLEMKDIYVLRNMP